MIKLSKNLGVLLFLGMALLLSLITMPAKAQDLEKKYAPILGEYEFDMSDAGMGIMTAKIYIENDAIWAWPDVGEPGEMIPKEGEEFVFTIEDEMSMWVLTFLKDESGKYTKCHAVNEAQGIDMTGEKIIK